jgi:dipeptidase D
MNPTELILEKFEQISSIPRGTKFEAGIRQWLIAWGAARDLKSRTDAAGNLVIYVPASAGYENQPTLILQGHMDMVWQKTPESKHNFEQDPIELIRDGDWIKANGTTLGADNGIGIALMLALVENESILHPALELLLTVAEENGLIGADHLDPALMTAKKLINLDSETVGVFTVGCAGGGSVNITLPVTWSSQATDEVAFKLRVGDLQGGHSGEDINRHRANANKLLARLLDEIQRMVEIRLVALKGGTARNAIPRAAEAVFACPVAQAALCHEVFTVSLSHVQAEHATLEPGMSITLTELGGEPVRAIQRSETVAGLRLLVALPHGGSPPCRRKCRDWWKPPTISA